MSRPADFFWPALRLGLGALFIYSSLYKIATPGAFAHEVHNYRLLPVALVNPVAIVLPWLQLFCGAALIANRLRLGSSALVAAMMLVFCGAVASALIRGLNIACGCFKAGGSAATWTTFARDATLCALALIHLAHEWRKERTRGAG